MKLMREVNVLGSDNKKSYDKTTKVSSNAKDARTNADVYTVATEEDVIKKVGDLEIPGKEIQLLTSAIKLEKGKHLVLITESVYEGKIYHKIVGLAADASISAVKKSA